MIFKHSCSDFRWQNGRRGQGARSVRAGFIFVVHVELYVELCMIATCGVVYVSLAIGLKIAFQCFICSS